LEIQLNHSSEDLIAIRGTCVRLNVQVEHPRGRRTNWKPIVVRFEFCKDLNEPPVERTIRCSNEAGFSLVREDLTLPDIKGEFRLGELFVECDGKTSSIPLPNVRILTLDGFFEETVAEKLRTLGFKTRRISGSGNPDILATPKGQPDRTIQVETTIEAKYDLSKWRSDIGKYYDLKDAYNLKQLLVVPLVSAYHITNDVKARLNRVHDPFSLISYEQLETLCTKYTKYLLGESDVTSLLTKPGLIEVKS
jgi:hypothetical protein